MKAPTGSNAPRELVPAGNHVARLYEIVYLGTLETPFKNDDGTTKEQYKVRLTFELPNELRKFGEDEVEKPMVISKECTFSMYKGTQTAVLRLIAHALIGTALKDEEAENFDIDDLLGMACMVEISHEEYEGRVFAKAVGFGSIPKGMTVPEQINESRTKSVSQMTREEIDELPEFLANKMKGSREYYVRFLAPRSENPETDLPQAVKEAQEIDPEDSPF